MLPLKGRLAGLVKTETNRELFFPSHLSAPVSLASSQRHMHSIPAQCFLSLWWISQCRGVPPPHPLHLSPDPPKTARCLWSHLSDGSSFVPHVLASTREIAVSPQAGPLGDFPCSVCGRGALHPHRPIDGSRDSLSPLPHLLSDFTVVHYRCRRLFLFKAWGVWGCSPTSRTWPTGLWPGPGVQEIRCEKK